VRGKGKNCGHSLPERRRKKRERVNLLFFSINFAEKKEEGRGYQPLKALFRKEEKKKKGGGEAEFYTLLRKKGERRN